MSVLPIRCRLGRHDWDGAAPPICRRCNRVDFSRAADAFADAVTDALFVHDLTWACHVCDKIRPDAQIGVAHVTGDVGNEIASLMTFNVRYCLDNAHCADVAQWYRHVPFPGESLRLAELKAMDEDAMTDGELTELAMLNGGWGPKSWYAVLAALGDDMTREKALLGDR